MNLLPNTEKEELKKGLKRRFAIVALFLVAASFFSGFIMLLPTYFITRNHFSLGVALGASVQVEDEESIKNILKLPGEIDSKLKFFQSNVPNGGAIDYLSKIISFLPEKVKLTSISFSKSQSKGKSGIIVLVSGVAADRDSLVSFSNLLKGSGKFSLIDVPVSSLTKEKDLPFSMNIFIAD